MHMADALLTPAVAVGLDVVSVGAIAYASAKLKKDGLEEHKLPVMGVMGAFVFAAQMVNFVIPATGSSGHIGGGILLAAVLGPFAALLTLAAVLVIQCLFFADGGILALGCNVFNMGVCASMIAYPLVFKPLVHGGLSKKRLTLASMASVVLGLQLGAFCVVLETTASGITELPFTTFLWFMQPIHLAIGLGEGLITAAVLCFIYQQDPALLDCALREEKVSGLHLKKTLAILAALTVLTGGGLSLLASSHPDGLEWSIAGVAGTEELSQSGAAHEKSAAVQEATAFMPDYNFKKKETPVGTGTAGIVGGALTLALTVAAGGAIRAGKRKREGSN